jgi:hypothetical protein
MWLMLFKLLCGHALADFALQTDAMAKGKNRNLKPDYMPKGQKLTPCWPYWLSAHALIHAGTVYVITGVVWAAIFELVSHWLIDFAKCENLTDPHKDQFCHCILKVFYALRV